LLRELGVDVVPLDTEEQKVDRYVLSERAIVERYTGDRFLQGITDKTLFTSAAYIRDNYPLGVLVVEGEIDRGYRSFHPQAVRGALSAMVVVYGLTVLATPDVSETVALLAMMARQEQRGVPEISLIPKRKAADLADLQRRVVEMLPGCGLVLARELLQHFGGVSAIVSAPVEALTDVRGVGAKKATAIWRVLHEGYRSLDTERDLEDAIELDPGLLFDGEVSLLARQHTFLGEHGERMVVDLAYVDHAAQELVLVELKRGTLAREHETQLARYIRRAGASPLLRRHLEQGYRLRGVLATAAPCDYKASLPGVIQVRIVDRERAIDALRRARDERA
jgi:ERCC4-type nuclease